jgi:hypothetical protein
MSTLIHCSDAQRFDIKNPPYTVVVAFFAEAGSDRCALFLDDRSLVRNRLRRTHVADELLYYNLQQKGQPSAIRVSQYQQRNGQSCLTGTHLGIE